jgi:Ran-binding protein 1
LIVSLGIDDGRYYAVVSSTKMQEHAGSDKSCVWHAADFADGEVKEEMFAIRFGSVES